MAWGTTRLRDRTITFVSAGNLVREEEPDAVADESKENKEVALLSEEGAIQQESTDPTQATPPVETQEENPAAQPEVPINVPAKHSPVPRKESMSSQASEEIVFLGRRNPATSQAPESEPAKSIPIRTQAPEHAAANTISKTPPLAPDWNIQDSTSSEPHKVTKIRRRDRTLDRRGRQRIRRKPSFDEYLYNNIRR